MAAILEDLTLKNDITMWTKLLNFPKTCFSASNRGGKRWSLVKHVNNQLLEENDPSSPPYINASTRQIGKKHCCDALHLLISSVSMKLEEGDFRGAVRLASSEDSFAEFNTIAAKHPSPCEDSKFPPPPPVKRESDDILMIHEEA